MTQARDFADLLNASSKIDVDKFADTAVHGRRNLIINGAMQVWQRGTSQSSNGFNSVDRWTFYAGSGMSVSRSTDAPSEFTYSCSFGGTGDSSGLTTRLEGQDCARLVGKDVTVSFYLKQTTGAGAGAIVAALLYADTLDNFGGTTYIGQPTVNTTSDWARYEVTFTNLPAQAANGLALNFKTPSSSAVVFLITGVQLEVGNAASPFEHRSYGEELIQCQRYYTQTKSFTVEPGNQSTQGLAVIDTGVPMRARPTISLSGPLKVTDFGNTSTTQSSASVVHDGSSTDFANKFHLIRLSNFSGLNGRSWVSYLNSEYIILDAEL